MSKLLKPTAFISLLLLLSVSSSAKLEGKVVGLITREYGQTTVRGMALFTSKGQRTPLLIGVLPPCKFGETVTVVEITEEDEIGRDLGLAWVIASKPKYSICILEPEHKVIKKASNL